MSLHHRPGFHRYHGFRCRRPVTQYTVSRHEEIFFLGRNCERRGKVLRAPVREQVLSNDALREPCFGVFCQSPSGFLLPRFVNAGRRQRPTAKLHPGPHRKTFRKAGFSASAKDPRWNSESRRSNRASRPKSEPAIHRTSVDRSGRNLGNAKRDSA